MHEPFDKCGKARHIEAAKPRDEVATPYPQPLIGTGCTRRVHAPFGRCGKAHHTEVVEPGDEVANPYPCTPPLLYTYPQTTLNYPPPAHGVGVGYLIPGLNHFSVVCLIARCRKARAPAWCTPHQ